MLFLDFETRSRCDIRTAGSYKYAEDPSTEVICLSYTFDDGPVQTWEPKQGPLPLEITTYEGMIYAHNAAFERLVFDNVLSTNIPIKQWVCTAALSRANGGPSSLEDCGRFWGLGTKKDHRGAQLIRLLSVPQETGDFREDQELLREMIEYCEQDVRTTRALVKALRPFSPEELEQYHITERINDRGILIDEELAKASVAYAAKEEEEAKTRIHMLTGGEITTLRGVNTRAWVHDNLPEAARALMLDHTGKVSFDKNARARLLDYATEHGFTGGVWQIVADLDGMQNSSVAKFSRMVERGPQVRGLFMFCGGAATGRVSSVGLQLQNFPRACAETPEETRADIIAQTIPAGQVSETLKSMLRPAIVPEDGKKLVVLDWSSIEGRVNPWCYPCAASEAKLDIYRNGKDPYIINAAATFGGSYEEITAALKAGDKLAKNNRQIGKVQELALGYMGGVGAFDAMGRAYGLSLPEHEAKRIVHAWRAANPWAMQYAEALETAYTAAMRNKGREFKAGRTTYLFDGAHLWYSLPSGRVLRYPFAAFDEDGGITYAKAAWKPAALAKDWPKARLWKGLAMENICQATANDILRAALARCEEEGVFVVATVHDEIIAESGTPENTMQILHDIMTTPPSWAKGLPLAAEGAIMERYGK